MRRHFREGRPPPLLPLLALLWPPLSPRTPFRRRRAAGRSPRLPFLHPAWNWRRWLCCSPPPFTVVHRHWHPPQLLHRVLGVHPCCDRSRHPFRLSRKRQRNQQALSSRRQRTTRRNHHRKTSSKSLVVPVPEEGRTTDGSLSSTDTEGRQTDNSHSSSSSNNDGSSDNNRSERCCFSTTGATSRRSARECGECPFFYFCRHVRLHAGARAEHRLHMMPVEVEEDARAIILLPPAIAIVTSRIARSAREYPDNGRSREDRGQAADPRLYPERVFRRRPRWGAVGITRIVAHFLLSTVKSGRATLRNLFRATNAEFAARCLLSRCPPERQQ